MTMSEAIPRAATLGRHSMSCQNAAPHSTLVAGPSPLALKLAVDVPLSLGHNVVATVTGKIGKDPLNGGEGVTPIGRCGCLLVAL